MVKINNVFQLFQDCKLVKGFNRGIIYDLSREDFDYVPLDLIDILEEYNGKTIENIITDFGDDQKEVIIEYFQFLIDKEYIFFCELDPIHFPKLSEHFEPPFLLHNLILDVTQKTFDSIDRIYQQIENIGCQALMLRFYSFEDYDLFFYECLKKFHDSSVRTIEIILPCVPCLGYSNFSVNEIAKNNGKISKIVLFSSDENASAILDTHILFIKIKDKLSPLDKNITHPHNFIVNKKLYNESKKYNSYYNKKIYIDGDGNCYNAPESKSILGNIKINQLQEFILNPDNLSYWEETKKDNIKICKDCEYRYMCINSIPLVYDSQEKLWQKEELCGYNPYVNKWDEGFIK